MKSAFLFLLFLSVMAISLGAPVNKDQQNKTLSVTAIIEKVNKNIKSPLLQGDIMTSSTKNADPCTSTGCKWRKSDGFVYIPFEISSSYSWFERNAIISALETFHAYTCIRFISWQWGHRDFLFFFSGEGCWSYLGRQDGGQRVSLQRNACLSTGTIQHEVLHALGFHHEQVRSDRDQYVWILYENIEQDQEYNFHKVQTNNLGTPYDFNSVMEYGNYDFSKNGQPTIIAKSNPSISFGHASYMSAIDIQRVNRLYGC